MKMHCIAALGLCVFSLNFIQAQVFNFDDGSLTDTTGEVTLAPFNIFGSGQIPAPASGTLEVSNGELRLSAAHFGNGTASDPAILGTILGPTRIGVVNPTPYQDFEVSVYLTDPGTIEGTGEIPITLIGARLTDVGPGTTKGYGVQVGMNAVGDLLAVGLVKSLNEFPTFMKREDGASQAYAFPFTEASQFLITFTGRGSVLEVFVDDLSTETNGITFTSVDTEFQAGVTGFLVGAYINDPEKSVMAAIDSFSARPAPELPEAPELTIQEAMKLTWPSVEGNFELQTTRDLIGAWRKVDAPVINVDGTLQATVLKEATNRFYRLRPIAD